MANAERTKLLERLVAADKRERDAIEAEFAKAAAAFGAAQTERREALKAQGAALYDAVRRANVKNP